MRDIRLGSFTQVAERPDLGTLIINAPGHANYRCREATHTAAFALWLIIELKVEETREKGSVRRQTISGENEIDFSHCAL